MSFAGLNVFLFKEAYQQTTTELFSERQTNKTFVTDAQNDKTDGTEVERAYKGFMDTRCDEKGHSYVHGK